MNENRRLQERKQPERVVFCKLGGEGSSLVLDLSEDGLCFESLTPIEEKDSLQLSLSIDPNSPIEAIGKLAWIDSSKRTGGLRFLDLSAPAREQIRAWLSATSPASSETNSRLSLRKRDADDGAATVKWSILEQTRVPSLQLLPIERVREETRVPSMLLVPIERYRKQTRTQFLRGVLVGFGVGAVVMIPILRYAGGTKPGSPAPTAASANRATPSSGEQTRESVIPPVPLSPSISKPAAKPLATQPAAVHAVFVAAPTGARQKQSPQTAGASSTDLRTRPSSPTARPQPTNAEQPLGASLGAAAIAPAASKVNYSSGQAQHAKKGSATPQQLWSALQAGNINVAVALADLYARGEGVPVNCQQARVLLLAASAKNVAEASKKLQALDKGGCPTNKE
ncbi:MAG TPA: PilZ domain-containing protein [Candidatus Acidoferrum sp.]